uniref:Tumor necrosis factor receptor superfamily member 6-like isoform X1 n=1 Tax=Pogona vitticeps TaxID=103695 RepID=A0ABM5F8P4_9SAUR
MVLALWLAFSACWLAKVESPALKLDCASDEYPTAGRCCRKCPAGTYVREHCFTPHTSGYCRPCEEGEDYTEHENGLEQCLPCDKCKSGSETVRPCTTKSNTKCQCRYGYYCPPSCEECLRCKTKCPEGQVIVQSCNATTDTKCGSPTKETTDGTSNWIPIVTSVVPVVLVLLLILGIFLYKRRNAICKSEEKDSKIHLVRDVKKPMVIVKNSSSKELRDIYFNVKNMVLPHDWNTLMRKCGLSDVDIDKITRDYPHDTNEQYHQMLRTLQDRFGIEGALHKLLNGLWDMNLKTSYENITNELADHNIITMEPEE